MIPHTALLLSLAGVLWLSMSGGAPASRPATAPLPRPRVVVDHWLKSDRMEVGFSRAMGGAIVHVSVPGGPNLINTFDPGRLLQQSYYAGQILDRPEHHRAWKRWAWNPIQGGDAFNHTPGCAVFELLKDGRFFTESSGLNWPAKNERLRSTIRQWASFESPGVLRVECEFVADREEGDAWGVPRRSHQEIPAGYFVADLTRVLTYREGKPVEFPHKQWNFAEKLPERWAAAVDDAGRGIGLYSREATLANVGKSGTGKGGPESVATMHIAPIITRAFKPKDRFTYTYYVILGDVDTIRATARALFDAGK